LGFDRGHRQLQLDRRGHRQAGGVGPAFGPIALRHSGAGLRGGARRARRRKPRRARAGRAAAHRRGAGTGAPLNAAAPAVPAQPIFWPVLAQSARKASSPLSVSGCLTSAFSVAGGTVATSAPISAACLTWLTVRTEAARISVLKSKLS